jgi:hypothetical protein
VTGWRGSWLFFWRNAPYDDPSGCVEHGGSLGKLISASEPPGEACATPRPGVRNTSAHF